MAVIHVINPTTIRIEATLEDAMTMVREAASDIPRYARDIVTIAEKMPEFEYTYFCFYAYDSAELFERMLGVDPKQYLSFGMDAPDAFFYALYGGMSALSEQAKESMEREGETLG